MKKGLESHGKAIRTNKSESKCADAGPMPTEG